MDTVQVENLPDELASFLLERGYKLDRLDAIYVNVRCESKRTDTLTDCLDQWNLVYRLV